MGLFIPFLQKFIDDVIVGHSFLTDIIEFLFGTPFDADSGCAFHPIHPPIHIMVCCENF